MVCTENRSLLTHFLQDEIAAISQMIFSNVFSQNDKFSILIRISLKFVPNGPIDNMAA